MNSKTMMSGKTVFGALLMAAGLLMTSGTVLAHETMKKGMETPMADAKMMKDGEMGMAAKGMDSGKMMEKEGMASGKMAADGMMDGKMDNGMKK